MELFAHSWGFDFRASGHIHTPVGLHAADLGVKPPPSPYFVFFICVIIFQHTGRIFIRYYAFYIYIYVCVCVSIQIPVLLENVHYALNAERYGCFDFDV